MEDMLIGTTDRTILVFIPDPASTTGAGKTGLNAAAVTITYTRVETDNDVVHNDVTSSVNDLSALTDAHNDWGWKEVNSTLSKGLYRLDVADAVFASGAWEAVVQVTITSGTAAATPKAFRLIARNDLTDISQTGDSYTRIGAPAGASVSADVAAVKSDTAAILLDTGTDGVVVAAGSKTGYSLSAAQTFDLTGNITGNLSGSVGSVTGNVGGNVTGSVGSVVGAVGSVTGAVGSVTGLTASDVAAIKAKTDALTFTVSGQVDANIQYVNDVEVTGTGAVGDEWGP